MNKQCDSFRCLSFFFQHSNFFLFDIYFTMCLFVRALRSVALHFSSSLLPVQSDSRYKFIDACWFGLCVISFFFLILLRVSSLCMLFIALLNAEDLCLVQPYYMFKLRVFYLNNTQQNKTEQQPTKNTTDSVSIYRMS